MYAYSVSTPVNVSPVNAKYVPNCPSSLDRKKLPPTSVKNPILLSGIANTVFSVAILKGAWSDKPTPPPIVAPFMNAT